VTELHDPADLVSLWTSRTLSDPLPALAAASDTATATGRPVILCTHQHTARAGYTPGPTTRLITTHQPPEVPPRPPGSPWHVHLSPGPTAGELARAVAALLLSPPH
jgi:nicotinamidase-related amidase